MSRRQRRTYSKEFKQQIVDLYLAGKPRAEIIREYELTPSSFDKWMKQAQSTGSFKERDNLTPEQAELIALIASNITNNKPQSTNKMVDFFSYSIRNRLSLIKKIKKLTSPAIARKPKTPNHIGMVMYILLSHYGVLSNDQVSLAVYSLLPFPAPAGKINEISSNGIRSCQVPCPSPTWAETNVFAV